MSTDNYFNIQLRDAEEIVDGRSKGLIGEIFIRCNNVLWIGEEDLEKEGGNDEVAEVPQGLKATNVNNDI